MEEIEKNGMKRGIEGIWIGGGEEKEMGIERIIWWLWKIRRKR